MHACVPGIDSSDMVSTVSQFQSEGELWLKEGRQGLEMENRRRKVIAGHRIREEVRRRPD